MKDQYGREISYMRISVTDKCNLRCRYCIPEEGVKHLCHEDIMSIEEIAETVAAGAKLGIKKVRLTGGEPLVRKGVVELCRQISAIPEIEDLSITTNGLLLPKLAGELKGAGVNRVNLSLDTLDPEKYAYISRGGDFAGCIAGIRAAFDAGFSPVKINSVLIGGFNDDEIRTLALLAKYYPIEMRFIELMPIGAAAGYEVGEYLPITAVTDAVPELIPTGISGTAKLYKFPDGKGRVGLISPISSHFCAGCNRIRLTADGKIKPCLHSDVEKSVRGLHGDALISAVQDAIFYKPQSHGVLSRESPSDTRRTMNQIGG